jgi:hypothetical protein
MNVDDFKKLLAEQEERLANRLEERLSKQLDEQEERLAKRLGKQLDEKLDERLEKNNAVLFGQLAAYVDHKLDGLRSEMNGRFDRMEMTLDRDAKAIEKDDQERLAMDHKLDRHEGWIGQLAESTGTKLVPER